MSKRNPTEHRRKLRDFNSLFKELEQETDRAVAVLGAAFLDGLLEEYVRSFMIDDAKEVDKLLSSDRALGAFGARITATFCLGLTTEQEMHDLRIIQVIRNKFAHELPGISFGDDYISKQCKALVLPGQVPSLQGQIGTSTRERFIAAVALLMNILQFRTIEINKQRRQAPAKLRVGYDTDKDFR